jgi:hypothetical protein
MISSGSVTDARFVHELRNPPLHRLLAEDVQNRVGQPAEHLNSHRREDPTPANVTYARLRQLAEVAD